MHKIISVFFPSIYVGQVFQIWSFKRLERQIIVHKTKKKKVCPCLDKIIPVLGHNHPNKIGLLPFSFFAQVYISMYFWVSKKSKQHHTPPIGAHSDISVHTNSLSRVKTPTSLPMVEQEPQINDRH